MTPAESEREACAAMLDDMAMIATTAAESFAVLNDKDNADRHRVRAETFRQSAYAIRERGDLPKD